MKSATFGGATSTYVYDGDGKRASKTVGATTTSYVYDVNASLPNVLTDGTLKYVYGLGLAYTVDGSGNVQVYHTDGLGSVRAITDGNGNITATYQTDEFGIPTQTQGSTTQPFQFTGQQRDAEGGLYNLRARMYDPSIGRFLSRDPWPGIVNAPATLNRFAYVDDNPVNLVDASGACAAMAAALKDKCETERRTIESLAQRQKLRYDDLLEDNNDLYVNRRYGTFSWQGHIDRYLKDQAELRIAIEFYNINCKGPFGELPESDTQWAYKRPPSKPDPKRGQAISYGPGINSSTIVTGTEIAAGVYIAYRVIRFLPSLTPELWWTIPINAAVP